MWHDKYIVHSCDLPYDVTPEDLDFYWTCDVCNKTYAVTLSSWTGWWSHDTEFEAVKSAGTIYCKWAWWVTCSPNITFTPTFKGSDVSAYSAEYEYPPPKPEWIQKREDMGRVLAKDVMR